ncbi:MAG: HEAT repeat domain-containing protein, partial [Planctomycetes bacterium]|nr:HEAT repeat domain-containing protein [Planctomycetota bacterium]
MIDIRDEATASRDHLASDIAQVASDSLRAQLLGLECGNNGDCRLAHWYAGEVQVSGEWKSLDEARQLAADDPELTDYYILIDKSRDALKDHEKLAKWCRKHQLPDLERLHWLHVLRFQSHHRAALNVLNLVWHEGVLLKEGELKHQIERERLVSRQKKKWKVKVKQLRRALEHGEPEQRAVARKEIREIRDPAAVPALLEEFQAEAATEAQTVELHTELMDSLGKIPAPEAVETLVENAVFAPAQSVRYAAANQLRSKQYAEYLPLLLSELEMPIEAAVSFLEIGNRIVTSYSYAQEDATGTERERFYSSYRTIPGPRYI